MFGAAQGALVANYPWDANESGGEGYAASPDDSAFRFLATTYATTHKKMVHANEFAAKGGITNGAEWYQISGSMQVWAYILLSNNELDSCSAVCVQLLAQRLQCFLMNWCCSNDKSLALAYRLASCGCAKIIGICLSCIVLISQVAYTTRRDEEKTQALNVLIRPAVLKCRLSFTVKH